MSSSEKAQDKAKEVQDKAKEVRDKAADKAGEAQQTLVDRLREDGVVNPSGLGMLGATFLFLGMVPVTTWLSQPNSLIEKAVNGLCSTVAYVGSAGSTSQVAQTGKIAALATFYVASTFAMTGAGSAAAVHSGNEGGRDNTHPRAQESTLTGLPLRLLSAHKQMVETFGGWAVTAALAQSIAPGDQSVINLLGLHVISKVLVFWPCYIFNYGTARSVAHVLATSSVIGVALQLSKKPLL